MEEEDYSPVPPRKPIMRARGLSAAREFREKGLNTQRKESKWDRLKAARNMESPGDLPEYDSVSPFPVISPSYSSSSRSSLTPMDYETESAMRRKPSPKIDYSPPTQPIIPMKKPRAHGKVEVKKLGDRVRKTSESTKFQRGLEYVQLPDFNLPFSEFMTDVKKKFGPESEFGTKFTYTNEDIEAPYDAEKLKCGSKTIYPFSKHQNFINAYFRPENPAKGMLIFHDVGTGKTCLAISMLSRVWIPAGYKILWVTKRSKDLQNQTFNALLDEFCDVNMREAWKRDQSLVERVRKTKEELGPRKAFDTYIKKYLGDKNWGHGGSTKRFMNYREFEHMLRDRRTAEGFFSESERREGIPNDVLRKTLIVIDEAHTLFTPHRDDPQEVPDDASVIESAIFNSYAKSGDDSCRVLLLSGTPYQKDIVGFARLLNLLLPSHRLPTDRKTLVEKVAAVGRSEEEQKRALQLFQERFKGLISHVSYEENPSVMPQKSFHIVHVQVDEEQEQEVAGCLKRRQLRRPEKHGEFLHAPVDYSELSPTGDTFMDTGARSVRAEREDEYENPRQRPRPRPRPKQKPRRIRKEEEEEEEDYEEEF